MSATHNARPLPHDESEIRRGVSLLVEPGSVVELRPMGPGDEIASGYFADRKKFIAAAVEATVKGFGGVYVTLNGASPSLLARAANRMKWRLPKKAATTADKDIPRRTRLLIDADAIRPAGISSSNAEHDAAAAKVRAIRDRLKAEGWPEPAMFDSGNGGHLIYKIDLPAEDDGLIQRVLVALGARHDDAVIKIDRSVFNAARITKLPGTLTRKGDDTAERPWRMARVLEAPESLEVVSRELLEKLAAEAPVAPVTARVSANGSKPSPSNGAKVPASQDNVQELADWLNAHGQGVTEPKARPDGQTIFPLEACPFDSSHAGGSACVGLMPSGARWFKCQHESCSGKKWADFKLAVAPDEARVPCEDDHDGEHLTDLGNARRLVRLHGPDIRFNGALGWHVWDGVRWSPDIDGEIERRAMSVPRELRELAAQIELQAAAATDAEERERLESMAEAVRAWAKKSESEPGLRHLVTVARVLSEVVVHVHELDRDPWALNVLNGTIDLKTGIRRDHRREDLLTKLCPVIHNPNAQAPRWERFLNEIMGGNKHLVGFLQRAAGYALTGDTREHALFFLHGSGRNGKSVFLEVLRALLGDYGETAGFDTFLAKPADNGPKNDIAKLRSARLVVSIEARDGCRFSEETIKTLTGGDRISARFLFREFFEFMPAFKIFLAANHKPTIGGTDVAIWARMKMIPFNVCFLGREDKTLKETLIRDELPGILNWAIAGCLAWQKDGIGEPQEVSDATQSYREEQDTLKAFIDDVCIVAANARVSATALFKSYSTWARGEGRGKALARGAFVDGLLARKHERKRSGKGGSWEWHGLSLNPAVQSELFPEKEAAKERQAT